jgi:hypothetical protein
MASPIDNMCEVDGCPADWVIAFKGKNQTNKLCEWHCYLVNMKDERGQKVEVQTKQVWEHKAKTE